MQHPCYISLLEGSKDKEGALTWRELSSDTGLQSRYMGFALLNSTSESIC